VNIDIGDIDVDGLRRHVRKRMSPSPLRDALEELFAAIAWQGFNFETKNTIALDAALETIARLAEER
jgi:hypothetical protein